MKYLIYVVSCHKIKVDLLHDLLWERCAKCVVGYAVPSRPNKDKVAVH